MDDRKGSDFILAEEEPQQSEKSFDSILRNTETVKKKKEYKLYPIRWFLLLGFSAAVAGSGLAQIGLSPIASLIAELYEKSDVIISIMTLSFTIFFIPLIFPVNYIIENYGISIPVYISSTLLVIGAWIRLLVNQNFYFLFAGQLIMAWGQPFVVGTPARMAGLWFGDKERATATTLGSLSVIIGVIIGYVLPIGFISDKDVGEGIPKEQGENAFFKYLLVQSIVITVLGVPIMLFIRNTPPTPPSASAETSMKMKTTGLFRNVWKLIKDINFLWMMVAFSSIYSIYTALGAILAPLTKSFDYDATDNSIFGLAYVLSGVAGSFVHAILLDKYARYKLQFILIGVLSWITFALITFLIDQGNVPLSAVLIVFLGLSQIPVIGVGYSFWAELTYPVNEALSCGLLHLLSSAFATGITFLSTALISAGRQYLALYILLGLSVFGLFWKLIVKEILKKRRAGIRGTTLSFHSGNASYQNPVNPATTESRDNISQPLIDTDKVYSTDQ